jgi:trigger factor
MQISVTATGGLERRMEVAVPAARVAGEIDQRLRDIARSARLKGFRPGKAPLTVIKQSYGSQVQSEVVGDLLQRSFAEAVSQEKLKPAMGPRIESMSAEPGSDLKYVAVFEIMPEIALKPLESLSFERPEATINEADLEAMLENLRRQRPVYKPVERAAQKDDRVVVDFDGRIGGEAFAGGTGTDVAFVIGAGRMLAEFEAGVTGASKGETRNVTVNFPPEYGSPEVAGKMGVFAVTLKGVEEPSLPPLDEEFCRNFGVAEGGVEKLRTEVRESMERELASAQRARLRSQVLDALYRENPIELPKSMIEAEVRDMQADMARRLGVKDTSQLPAPDSLQEGARRRVALGLIFQELIRAARIELDRARVNARVSELVSAYPNADEMRRQYLQSADAMRQIESTVLEEQATDWVLSKASVTARPSSFMELTGFNRNTSKS